MEARKETRVAKTKGPAGKKAVAHKAKAKQPKVKVITETVGMNDPTDSMLAAIHESMSGLHNSGLIDKETMRGFDESCLPKVKVLQANEIKVLRTQTGVSQAVFAQYLNTTSQPSRMRGKVERSATQVLLSPKDVPQNFANRYDMHWSTASGAP